MMILNFEFFFNFIFQKLEHIILLIAFTLRHILIPKPTALVASNFSDWSNIILQILIGVFTSIVTIGVAIYTVHKTLNFEKKKDERNLKLLLVQEIELIALKLLFTSYRYFYISQIADIKDQIVFSQDVKSIKELFFIQKIQQNEANSNYYRVLMEWEVLKNRAMNENSLIYNSMISLNDEIISEIKEIDKNRQEIYHEFTNWLFKIDENTLNKPNDLSKYNQELKENMIKMEKMRGKLQVRINDESIKVRNLIKI